MREGDWAPIKMSIEVGPKAAEKKKKMREEEERRRKEVRRREGSGRDERSAMSEANRKKFSHS